MIRTFLMSGRIATVATGLLLIALSGASLGCALVACHDLFFAPPKLSAATTVADLVHSSAPSTHPAVAGDHLVRCSAAVMLRARRSGHATCRAVDLLPV